MTALTIALILATPLSVWLLERRRRHECNDLCVDARHGNQEVC